MKLVMTLLVRDEEDILEDNLRFHLAQGVDFFVVTDNASTDSTPAILDSFARSGVLEWTLEPEQNYAQGHWVTRMARRAATVHGADWVINNDADEFWCPRRHATLKEALAGVPEQFGTVVAPRSNFVPRPPAPGRPVEWMTVREIESKNRLGKPLPPKVCHRGSPTVVVVQGNHAAAQVGKEPLRDESLLEVLHFPLRTFPQFERKIAQGGSAYARNTELPEGVGLGKRILYRRYLAGELPAYWASNVVSDADVETGIADGRLVRDERVKRVLEGARATTV